MSHSSPSVFRQLQQTILLCFLSSFLLPPPQQNTTTLLLLFPWQQRGGKNPLFALGRAHQETIHQEGRHAKDHSGWWPLWITWHSDPRSPYRLSSHGCLPTLMCTTVSRCVKTVSLTSLLGAVSLLKTPLPFWLPWSSRLSACSTVTVLFPSLLVCLKPVSAGSGHPA